MTDPRCELCRNRARLWLGKAANFGVCGIHYRWVKRRVGVEMHRMNRTALRQALGFVFPAGGPVLPPARRKP